MVMVYMCNTLLLPIVTPFLCLCRECINGKKKVSDVSLEATMGDRTIDYILKMLYQGEEKER